MKSRVLFIGVFLIGMIACTVCVSAQGSESFMGNWEGMFMNDFRTLLKFECDTAQNISGRILLFEGEKQIQDDELFKINIQDSILTFYIMSKETHYKGVLDRGSGELKGIFIFPDDSEHPLTVIKKESISH